MKSIRAQCELSRQLCRRWFIALALAVGAVLPSLTVAGSQTAGEVPADAPEYNLKAGLLTLFTRFTEWPTNSFDSTNAPIIIGVLGEDPFGEVLVKTAEQTVCSHPLQVRHLTSPEAATGCHLVFISSKEKGREEKWLAALKGKPIVTVGESGHTIERGGILEFKTLEGRVRFDVSLPAMQQAGVKLKSDMLQSANKVFWPQGERH